MKLEIRPNDIVFFVDESGDEKFSDPNHPVFVMGGCAVFGSDFNRLLVEPWRAMKVNHFGGAEVPLHASAIRSPTVEQLRALTQFFGQNHFYRFAVAFTGRTVFEGRFNWLAAFAASFRQRAMEIIGNAGRIPERAVFLHEASDRGDKVLQRHFGRLGIAINGKELPIERGIISKVDGGPALEVADFIVQAVGGQARTNLSEKPRFRKDFDAIFKSVPDPLCSYIYVTKVEKTRKSLSERLADKRLRKKLRPLALQRKATYYKLK